MLSVVIIVKNEEWTIRRCLESVKWADEIIVVDSGSEDSTLAIAADYTTKVFTTDWQGYGVQKQRALAHATGDWVLNLDADEVVDFQLKQAILKAMAADDADAYQIPIRLCFADQLLKFSYSPSRHVRLFKRQGARYSDDVVHEKIILPPHARIGRLTAFLRHYSFRDVSHMLYKLNRYSSYSAKARRLKHKAPSISKVLLGSVWMFIRSYVLQGGFLEGRVGFLFAVYNAQGTFYRGMKQLYPDHKDLCV